MTFWILRTAAFCLGITVALSTAHAERQCWMDGRGLWTCSDFTPRREWREHEHWRNEHRRDWRDWHDEHRRDWRDEHREDYR